MFESEQVKFQKTLTDIMKMLVPITRLSEISRKIDKEKKKHANCDSQPRADLGLSDMDSGHVDGSISGPDPGSNPKEIYKTCIKKSKKKNRIYIYIYIYIFPYWGSAAWAEPY